MLIVYVGFYINFSLFLVLYFILHNLNANSTHFYTHPLRQPKPLYKNFSSNRAAQSTYLCPSGALEGASRERGETWGKVNVAARTPVKGEVMLTWGNVRYGRSKNLQIKRLLPVHTKVNVANAYSNSIHIRFSTCNSTGAPPGAARN